MPSAYRPLDVLRGPVVRLRPVGRGRPARASRHRSAPRPCGPPGRASTRSSPVGARARLETAWCPIRVSTIARDRPSRRRRCRARPDRRRRPRRGRTRRFDHDPRPVAGRRVGREHHARNGRESTMRCTTTAIAGSAVDVLRGAVRARAAPNSDAQQSTMRVTSASSPETFVKVSFIPANDVDDGVLARWPTSAPRRTRHPRADGRRRRPRAAGPQAYPPRAPTPAAHSPAPPPTSRRPPPPRTGRRVGSEPPRAPSPQR